LAVGSRQLAVSQGMKIKAKMKKFLADLRRGKPQIAAEKRLA
jgi:hypothetical protein